MRIVDGAVNAVTGAATATTSAVGAVGGAALGGVVGGVRGAASGARAGMESGSHSTPAAALTLAAVGAAGLVEWPVLVTAGGAALVLRQFGAGSRTSRDTEAPTSAAQ
ncbi:hypothetical protein [Rhodococcus sp. T2V]|uniref:hypothetical protein n=1 Tax=Rhodococcus sp. T2V TaxID=3034164 RepID=UPI0023E31123|nr:hypothetical protein [Rhodococcus sp. T2V]MDF3304205.1 hypothetical protein [Rhodococcus sp. T2V]